MFIGALLHQGSQPMAREKDLRQALERLLRQLELGQFVNEKGEKITDNYAFVEAKNVLQAVVR
jgi:hypothetical protein